MSCSEGQKWGFLQRIVDYTTRPITEANGSVHWIVRYAMTFTGTSIWALIGAFVLALSGNAQHLDLYGVGILAVPTSVLFTCLIATSIKRGTPLGFFLWGLSIPTFALSILKFAFLFGYPNR